MVYSSHPRLFFSTVERLCFRFYVSRRISTLGLQIIAGLQSIGFQFDAISVGFPKCYKSALNTPFDIYASI